MQDGFSRSLKNVLVHEGGKVDHPKDPGGRTNQGVTQRVYVAWRRRKGLPGSDVWAMTTAERDAIYREQYWNVVKGDDLPPGVDYVVFDGAVNSGPAQSVKWLQRALGSRYTGKIDGVLGSVTLEAVCTHPNHDLLIRGVCDRRMAFLQALKTWKTFGRGWTARVQGVSKAGQAWAMGDTGPQPVEYVPGCERKANIEDAKPAPGTGIPDSMAGGGGAAAGGSEAVKQTVEQAKDQLSPFGDLSWVSTVLLALTIIGVLCLVGGIAWRWYAKRKARERADALDLGEPKLRFSEEEAQPAWDEAV